MLLWFFRMQTSKFSKGLFLFWVKTSIRNGSRQRTRPTPVASLISPNSFQLPQLQPHSLWSLWNRWGVILKQKRTPLSQGLCPCSALFLTVLIDAFHLVLSSVSSVTFSGRPFHILVSNVYPNPILFIFFTDLSFLSVNLSLSAMYLLIYSNLSQLYWNVINI